MTTVPSIQSATTRDLAHYVMTQPLADECYMDELARRLPRVADLRRQRAVAYATTMDDLETDPTLTIRQRQELAYEASLPYAREIGGYLREIASRQGTP